MTDEWLIQLSSDVFIHFSIIVVEGMIRILLLYSIIVSNQLVALRRQCLNTGILFPDKISRSPIIIYGKSLAKRIYLETDTELLFNVTFRVDCIFKGDPTEGRIEITDAGRR